jgi:hypothetical protein
LVWRLVRLARTGEDLIALGEILEVLTGFETDPATCAVEVNVGVEVGFTAGNENFEEGLYYGFRVSDEGIEFDEMRTTYDKSVGSDHESKEHGFLAWDDSNSQDPSDWFNDIEDVLCREECGIEVSRDHA